MLLIDKLFLFNPFSKFFRSARKNDEIKDNEEIQNSVGVSQEQIDLHNYINYNYLASPGSAVTYIGISFEQYFANKHGRIQKYKEMSIFPEISDSIDLICDDSIVSDTSNNIVTFDITEEMPKHVEEEIRRNWNYLVNDVFSFNERAWDLFRKWIIEAELYIELILNNEGNNIIGIKVLPAHTMMPIYDENKISGYMQTKISNSQSQDVGMQQGSIVFDKDQIVYVNYGLYGANMLDVRGYLESAIRVYNQLKNMEDALVVYRLCRAPERRVWNVAVGRMSKSKAEEYLNGLIQRYRKKIIYNADNGEIDSTANIQSLTEDFWFTRNENGEGTTVENIGGGMQLGELTDVNYFLQKLYKTLKLPRSRWDDTAASMYSSGKSGEILREEIKFSRFIERLQNRFKYILINPFITLLRLKGIDEKYINEKFFSIKFNRSNLFKEYREVELIESKMSILSNVFQFMYDKNTNPNGLFSKEFVMRKFFMMSDEDWKENEELRKKEELQAKSTGDIGIGGTNEFGTGETGGTEFGGTPGTSETITQSPITAPAVSPSEEPAKAPSEAPVEEIIPPAESTNVNLKPYKDLSLFSNWESIDRNIRKKYSNNILK